MRLWEEVAAGEDHNKTQNTLTLTEIAVPENTSRKTWMDYRAVTDTNSLQYELISRAVHADNGLLYIDGHVAVALGSQLGPVGSKYIVEMSTGEELRLIKADEKQDQHTAGGEGWVGTDGHLMELVVDTDRLTEEPLIMGDCDSIVPGTVIRIEVEE